MTNNNQLIEQIKQRANIKDAEEVSPEKTKEILELYKKGVINEQHLEAFASLSHSFIDSIINLALDLPRLVEKQGDINETLLEQINHINQTVEILNRIASKATNDDVRLEIARLVVEVANQYNKTLENINTNNNNAFQRSIRWIGIVVIAVFAFFSDPND